MPLTGLVCPDGKTSSADECLKRCRLGERCLTLPTLQLITKEREWNGKASTTQLINGTMLEFLKLTQDYIVDLDSRAFMLQGTKHHRSLEVVAAELGLPAEIPLSIDRDIFDLIELEEGQLVLTDYKLWGSFKVATALGIVEVGKQPDPSGAVYQRSGAWGKAGSPKMVSVFQQVPDKGYNLEAELQLNRYRIMLEELGLKIAKMQLQITVRDGGIGIAKSRGVLRNIYKIPVKRLEDQAIRDYFTCKNDCLMEALKQGHWDSPCTSSESWEGRRCAGFCDVAQFCPKGVLVQSIGGEE